jgi:hypothetical protein
MRGLWTDAIEQAYRDHGLRMTIDVQIKDHFQRIVDAGQLIVNDNTVTRDEFNAYIDETRATTNRVLIKSEEAKVYIQTH